MFLFVCQAFDTFFLVALSSIWYVCPCPPVKHMFLSMCQAFETFVLKFLCQAFGTVARVPLSIFLVKQFVILYLSLCHVFGTILHVPLSSIWYNCTGSFVKHLALH